jgi:hypothetical protein
LALLTSCASRRRPRGRAGRYRPMRYKSCRATCWRRRPGARR